LSDDLQQDEIEEKVGSDTAPAFQREEQAAAGFEADGVEADGLEADGLEADADDTKVVKICKKCMVSQTDGGEFCITCGSKLVPIRAVRESYIGEMVGGKYKIVDRLGAGGMGEVYLGLNNPLGQRVAVKFLSKKFTADESIIMRFLNEARSYCKVNHPNAVTLLEYGQHEDGALYLITEFIEGKSLTDTLKEVGPFELDVVLSVAEQICEVLSAAHSQGVIHRDLKPDNIMLTLTSRGRYAAKVLDFGIAKIVDDDHQNGAMTETGSVFGTPEFMSPEQARGDSADPRSDLYAMGIILFYISTGRLPFKGKNKLVVLNKQLNEAPPRPSEARDDIDVPLRLEAVILKCLHKEPQERYQCADDLLEALEEVSSATHLGNTGAFDSKAGRTRRLGQASSDVAETAAETPPRVHRTDEPDIHENETVAYGIDDTLNTDPERAASVDFGEIDDEQADIGELDSVDMASEWAEREESTYVEDGRWKIIAMVVVVVLGAGAGLWATGLWGTDRDDSSPQHDEDAHTDQPVVMDQQAGGQAVDINRVLVTGQVIGALSAAEQNLDHGDLDAARRTLEATRLWVDDEGLPADALEKRATLEQELTRLEQRQRARQSDKAKARAEEKARQEVKARTEEKARQEAKAKAQANEQAAETNNQQSDEEPSSQEEGDTGSFALPPKKLD
jgi:serine/threonine protein kinase